MEIVKGEELNVLIGGKPFGDKEVKDRFKLAILKMLYDQYRIVGEDLVTAELEIVPAGPARDVGFDRRLYRGYGQDDRVCAYPSLRAVMDVESPEKNRRLFIE